MRALLDAIFDHLLRLIGAGIALIGILIAALTFIHKRRQDHREEQLRKKADVRVSLEETASAAHEFVIVNRGAGSAHNVNFKLRIQEGGRSAVDKSDCDERFPVRELLPGDRMTIAAKLVFETGTTFDVVLTWRDEDGSDRRREMRVSATVG